MPEADTSPVPQRNPRRAPQKRDASLPVLEKLAELYPHLFGAVFLPLKRGIFQDLLAAHPEVFETESLKAALSTHTRSTRYLNSVASGQMRHDLQGQAVEAMAPEHIHHALVEVFRRRQSRTQEDLQPRLLDRMLEAWEASGLAPQDYAERVRTRDAKASELLEACMALARERTAKGEALLRAFTTSGKTVEAFADMYGLDPEHTAQTLERARTQAA
ncbi:MAG TPA: ProQ/FINO family protein [Rhodoferax sp.]|jgi:sRNA-binding protein|nr:ProQ/FINO family protein [Rhodoferax sp.]HQY75550.1 ProQ/FINO family protein [Rhodoferax sp.]